MQTLLKSRQTSDTSAQINPNMMTKVQSTPAAPLIRSEDVEVKQKISAPSYLFSMKDNEAPPFVKPAKEPRPRLLIGTVMNAEEAIEMIAEDFQEGGLRNYLGRLLVKKGIIANYNLTEKNFLINLLTEVIDYSAQRSFKELKLSCLITLYLNAHTYFKWYYWTPPAAVWSYFKEIMIRHTIEDSPDGQEVFEPEECYDILTHFHAVYLSNLPLIHILTFGTYRLKFTWPFKGK